MIYIYGLDFRSCDRIRAFLVVRWLHLWLQRSSTIWKSQLLTTSDIKRKRTVFSAFCRYDDALRLALGVGLGSAYPLEMRST